MALAEREMAQRGLALHAPPRQEVIKTLTRTRTLTPTPTPTPTLTLTLTLPR